MYPNYPQSNGVGLQPNGTKYLTKHNLFVTL
ncbi:hypothetical protein [Caudoviricetes sp.]|nr:hypothetical protein [Caudoviricetes sp.]